MQIFSVAPGYTVDSKIMVVPSDKLLPISNAALSKIDKSGVLFFETGVGTATIIKSASFRLDKS